METVYFPVACTIAFANSGIRRIAARSFHSFKVEKFGSKTVNLTAPDGTIAYGVWANAFERLPAGYVWAKFKESHTLAAAKKDSSDSWVWLALTVRFEANRFYAIKILPGGDFQTGSCNFMTSDGKIFPYVDRYFSVVSEIRNSTPPRVIEAFPAPVPGVQREHDPGVWDAPTEYDSVPVRHDNDLFSRFKHPTLKPVAALRLELDECNNLLYRCSYFGPAPK